MCYSKGEQISSNKEYHSRKTPWKSSEGLLMSDEAMEKISGKEGRNQRSASESREGN